MTLRAPLACDGQVTHDQASRSYLVKESGIGGTYWRLGHEALTRANGSFGDTTPVFARVAGRGEIGHGEPVRDQWLRFQLSDGDYRALAREGVSAICIVDRQAGVILGVRFLG